MKKLVGLLIIAGLYVAAAYYMGVEGEKNLRQQFALAETQSEVQGVKLVLNHYERGVFFSEMDVTAVLASAGMPAAPINIHSVSKIQHGPLLFTNGFGFGLFSSSSSVEVTTADENVNKMLTDLFGESIGEIITRGHFNQAYTSTWTIPKVEHSKNGNSITIDGFVLTATGNLDQLDSSGTFELGASEWLAADSTRMTTSPMTGHFDITNISTGINIGDIDMAIDNITFLNASMVGFSIEQFKIAQTQKLVEGKIDTAVSFTAAKIKSPVEVSAFHYDLALNQLNPLAIKKWTEIAQAAQGEPEQMLAMYSEALPQLTPLLLQEGLQFTLSLGGDFMGGSALMNFTADYRPLPNGQQVQDIVDPLDYFKLADADVVIRVSEAIVTQTPLAMMLGPYMDTYITQEGDNFVMHATLKDGRMMVGNTEIPPETLLAFVSSATAEEADPAAEAIDSDNEQM